MKLHAITGTLALALLLPVAGCSRSGQSESTAAQQALSEADKQTSPSVISAQIHEAMERARRELATKDIDIDHIHVGHGEHGGSDSLPPAAITPRGDLLIAGKPVTATPEQHTMLLEYRRQIVGIAEAGMDIGEHGANLGTRAAKEAIWGALAGKSDKEIEASIAPQTEQLKIAAMKLCQRLPPLLASQQKLAAAMPDFRPYATMTQKDVDDCGKGDDEH
jgi:hypothetical protein